MPVMVTGGSSVIVRKAETVALSISRGLVESTLVRLILISYWAGSGVSKRPPLRTGEEELSESVILPAVSKPVSPPAFQGIASQVSLSIFLYSASKLTVAAERPP